MKSLVVGDVHVKTNNIELVDQLITFIMSQIRSLDPDIVVLLGDILDYHEKVITPCLNKAYQLIESVSVLKPVYVIVGNHDYISNSQFLTTNHWMNALKKWPNVTIVDRVIVERGATFCPYVSPGRLMEALSTVPGSHLSHTVFCHQEFRGCDMGVVKSETGDTYSDFVGLVVSGHIHDNQWLGSRVYYVGAPIQHAFGEKEKRVIALVDNGSVNEINVGIGLKRTITVNISDLPGISIESGPDVQTRITIVGSASECKSFKKTSKYKSLTKHAKLVFRVCDGVPDTPSPQKYRPFNEVCVEKIRKMGNPDVEKLFTTLCIE